MYAPVPKTLKHLANGLREYMIRRVSATQGTSDPQLASQLVDAHSVLVFMWDNWNEYFRHELSFAERSLSARRLSMIVSSP